MSLARILCVFCLLASPAAARVITVTEGYYPRISVGPGDELLITGGKVGHLNAVGGLSTIHGGAIESTRITNGAEVVMDGASPQDNGQAWINLAAESGGSKITLHGYHFRMARQSLPNHSYHNIQAYLLDGTFTHLIVVLVGNSSLHRFELVKHDPAFLDPTRDWNFDLEDLNAVRNSFGNSDASIDTNFDGQIDLADLNLVRNHFGDIFYYTPDMEVSGVISPFGQSTVPEPSSSLLVLGCLSAWLMWRGLHGPSKSPTCRR